MCVQGRSADDWAVAKQQGKLYQVFAFDESTELGTELGQSQTASAFVVVTFEL